MEHVTGVQPLRKWPHMSGGQKVLCIAALYEKLKQIVGLDFPTYGSIYPFTSSLDFLSKIQLETGFCIGPHCGTRYWDCGDDRSYHHTVPNQGPCGSI
jgi:hypothetical protein